MYPRSASERYIFETRQELDNAIKEAERVMNERNCPALLAVMTLGAYVAPEFGGTRYMPKYGDPPIVGKFGRWWSDEIKRGASMVSRMRCA